MAALAPYAVLVAAAVAGGVLVWKEWNSAQEEAAKNAKAVADAWKDLPGLLKQIDDMQQVGLLGTASAKEYSGLYLREKEALPRRQRTSDHGRLWRHGLRWIQGGDSKRRSDISSSGTKAD